MIANRRLFAAALVTATAACFAPPARAEVPESRAAAPATQGSSGAGAALYLYDIHGDVAAAGKADPVRVPLPPGKVAGVAFTADGILMTAESREVYRYREAPQVEQR